jgi:hypothetical protein
MASNASNAAPRRSQVDLAGALRPEFENGWNFDVQLLPKLQAD